MRQKLDFIIRGGIVKRFHTMHTLHTQNVAEHSFGVAWLVWLLSEERPTPNLLMAALSHDISEHTTGDIPAPAKRRMQISKQFDEEENEQYAAAGFELLKLTDWQKRTLKIADTMDLLLFCVRELNLGNSDMDVVYQRGVGYIRELEPLSNIELELLTIIGERYAGISKR
jgi:5'-deoxynucleotidase YfbR-like HD superfamily hydrolase